VLAALALGLWALACAGRGPEPRSIRLIERLGEARVVTAPGQILEVPASWLSAAELVAPSASTRGLARRRLPDGEGYDQRVSLAAPAGSRYEFTARVPRRGRLRLAWAAGAAAPGAAGEAEWRLGFRALVGSPHGAGTPARLLDETVRPGDPEGWREATLDLARWGGRTIRLSLETHGVGPAWGAWANPIFDAGPAARRPNLILISLDTVRADRLGAYGYRRHPTTPRLDRFAEQGIRFAWAIAQAPWTQPSHLSLLSGLHPASRGALPRVPLAAALWRAGYRTFAVTGGGQIDARYGFDAGFEVYRVTDWIQRPELVVNWVEGRTAGPFFLFLHTYEAHEPYTDERFARALPAGRISGAFGKRRWRGLSKQLTAEEKARVEALYDGDLSHADGQLGRWLAAAEHAGWLENSIVVVTSDHGEQFWEHGTWGHGQTLHDHQLHVPLLLHLPPRLARERLGRRALEPGSVVADQVQLMDLYPSLLELAGVALESPVQGVSLVPLLAGDAMPPREAFAERTNIRAFESKALRTLRFKFIYTFPRDAAASQPPVLELFDLRRDPAERENLAESQPEVVAGLRDRVLAIAEAGGRVADPPLGMPVDADLAAKLRALGYLDDGR